MPAFDSGDHNPPVPITILTGFLGAGKTTLLNHILAGDHGLRMAVLVNDFGAIGIDSELVVGARDTIISLVNGCVCCTIRDELAEAVLAVIARPEAPDYLLLEASGIADASGIAMTFADGGLLDRLRVDAIACVIDADQLFEPPGHPELTDLKIRQVGFCDLVIVNKADLAGPERLSRVREWLAGTFRGPRVIETSHCDVPLEILLGAGRFGPGRGADHGGGGDCAAPFSSWSYQTGRPLSLSALHDALRTLPPEVYRAKGVIHTYDAPGRRAELQLVGRRVDIFARGSWGERAPRTQIVVIGAAGSLDPVALEQKFAACVATATAEQWRD